MHLVQGTLDSTTTFITNAAGIVAFGAACYGARRELAAKQLPALLAMGGFVFLAQMVNCATGFGFSGHLVGAALLAILFGPCAAIMSMGIILAAQVALLGDGAWSTLGANFMNMGVVASLVAYAVYRLIEGRAALQAKARPFAAVGLASLASIVAASVSLSGMLGGSFSSMVSVHVVIGVFEAVLSVAVFALCVSSQSQELLKARLLTLKPIALLCLFSLCLLPLSSTQNDGLEHVLATTEAQVD